jgi:hypothetical protein
MLISTVKHEDLSPYIRKITDDLYPKVEPAFMPHFQQWIGLLGNIPKHTETFFPYYFSIWFENKLGPRISELARLAISQGTQCQLCQAVRYTPDVNEKDITAIPGADAATLDDKERAVVRFATLFGNNHHDINETHFADLKKHFSDEQITELMFWCAMCLGLGRILKVTQLVSETCPLPDTSTVEWVKEAKKAA